MQDIGTVREHMEVIGSDGEPIGTVDRIEGDRIKLTKDGPHAGGRHHFIPADWIAEIDGEVRLGRSAEAARHEWQEEAEGMTGSGVERIVGPGP